ncbi:toxin glutamine deamidase domain-containing protein [Streptomyces endophyticus]|uniref:Toxin glutamine deamidase domain-containing protein n=1 Tax=Streptomyces endophyticus TaxID=714166 RepID=A0ABU6F5W6_9ACTN|nr:toxin glutamine deamidase domain-containing protein [Streptomyces endophyticus]MEB8339389.1 toxin glutamine deamidase domain-containing protein [Streptomyces endophyticus]
MECANTWRQFAADVTELQSRGLTAAGNVLAENAGDSIDGFNKTWEKFAGGSGYFDDARQGAELIAICMDAAAMLIIGLKIAVIAQLVILALEIAAAQAAAPFTLGLSEIGAMGAAAATRMILRKLLKEIAQQILQAVLETTKEPFVSALEAMISDVVAQTVEQNFGKQSGYDLGRTAKTGYEEGKSALENSGSTFGESLRDGAGSRAGHGARGGLTNSGGDGDGGDGSSSSGGDGSSSSGGSSSGDSSSGGSPSSGNSPSGDSSSSSNSPSSSDSSSSPNSPLGDGGSSSDSSTSTSGSTSSSGGDSGRRAPDIGGPPSSSPSTAPSGGTDGAGGADSSDSSSSSPAPSRGSEPPSPFDVGTQAYQDSISQPSGSDSSSPDSAPESSTPSATTPDVEGGPAPDTTPDSARPDSTPDAPPSTPPGNEPSLSSDPSPNGSTRTTPDVSTSPTPDTTPDSAAPSRPEGAGTSAPDQGASVPDQRSPEPSPSTPPEAAPTPAPDNSSPDPGAHQVDRDSVSTMPAQAQGPTPDGSGDGTNNDNQSQGSGGRASMPSGAMPGNAPTSHAGPGQGHAPSQSSPTPHDPGDPSDPDIDLMGGVATAAPPAPHAQSGDAGVPQQAAASSAAPSTPAPGAMPPPTAGPIPTQAPAASGPTTTPRASTPSATTPRTDQPSSRPATPSRDTPQNRPASPPRTSTPRSETPSRPTTPPRGEQPTNRPTDHQSPPQSPTSTPNDQGMPAPNNQQPNTPQPDNQQPDTADQTPDQNQQPTTPPPTSQADNLSDIRDDLNIPHEGLATPDPAHQQDLENAHPRNPDGTPQVFADPRQGNWAGLQNDGGPGVPGRSNNCADCTRSFLETWFGRPTVSAPRTLDVNADGSLNTFSAERDSVDNQARWAGAPSTYAGKDHPNPYARIAHELSQAGHGSAAVIGVNWPGGGGHAFAAVNHNGQVLFVDPQTGVVSENPIHLGAQEVFYTPLDADRNPITPYFLTPSTPQPSTENTPDTQSSQPSTEPSTEPPPEPSTDGTPSDTDEDAQDDQDAQDGQDSQSPQNSPDSTEPTPSTATRPSGPPDGYDNPSDADNRAQQERFPRNEDGSFQQAPDPRDGSWLNDIRGQNPDDSGRDVNCPDGALAFTDSYAGNPTVAARRSPNEDGTAADTPEPGGRDRIESTLGAEFDDFGDGRDAYNNLETTLLNEGHGSQAVIITQNADGRAHAWNVVNHNGQIVYADQQTGQTSTTPLHNGNNGVFAIPLDANRRPLQTTGQPTAQNQNQNQGPSQNQNQNRTSPAPHSPAGSTPDPNDPSAEATRADRNQSLPSPETAAQAHANLPPDTSQASLRDSHHVHRIGMDPVQQQLQRWADPVGDPPRSPLSDLLEESVRRRQEHALAAHEVRVARDAYDRALKEVSDAKAARTRAEGALARARTPAATTRAEARMATAQQRLATAEQALEAPQAAHKAAMEAHQDVSMPPTSFTDSHLRDNLDPAWSQMNDGERYAAIAAIARISQSFHANNAVSVNPDPAANNDAYGDGNFHESAAAWRRDFSSRPDGAPPADVQSLRNLIAATDVNSPDLSGKNYAVVEVLDPKTGESHYIVDSSLPAGVDGAPSAHSESHILNWIDQLNENRGEQFQVKIKGLFTEREPCGLPTSKKTHPDGTVTSHPTGHANCSRTIQNCRAMDGVPVYYGTTYRADPEVKDLKAAEPDRLRDLDASERDINRTMRQYRTPSQAVQDAEMNDHREFISGLVDMLAPQRPVPSTPEGPDQDTQPAQAPPSGPSGPTGPDRTPPPDPAGADRRPPADPAGTTPPPDGEQPGSPAGEQRPADDDAQQPQATPADGHDLPGDDTLPEGPRGNLPDGSWEGENGLRLTPDENAAADDFLRQSAAAEPRITETLQQIAHNVDDGRLTGLDYRLKGEDSLKRKLATQMLDEPDRTAQSALGKVKDSIRYTVEFPDSHYTHGVQQAVDTLRHQGFENVTFKNTWGSEGYKGINSTWLDPDTGKVFEVQFHTPESFTAKMDTHVLYENGRLPGVSEAEREAIRAAQNDVFGRVPVPEGTEAINVADDLASTDSPADDPHVPAGHHGPGTVQSNAPPSELSPAEREASAERLHELEQQYQDDFDQLKQDPDHRGKVKPSELDEARVALDLRENGTVPQDIQRPPAANQGDLYSPSTQEYYDIKGVHSSWPPYNNVRDRSLPYKQAYDPANNEAWVNKLREQIVDKNRAVILDVRNANQAAIDDLAQIIEQNGWSERVVWYP